MKNHIGQMLGPMGERILLRRGNTWPGNDQTLQRILIGAAFEKMQIGVDHLKIMRAALRSHHNNRHSAIEVGQVFVHSARRESWTRQIASVNYLAGQTFGEMISLGE